MERPSVRGAGRGADDGELRDVQVLHVRKVSERSRAYAPTPRLLVRLIDSRDEENLSSTRLIGTPRSI
eukprot:30440-Pelagococcus_subviridis.AAC.3